MTVTVPHRGLICDLDGVVYRGRFAVPGAVDALTAWQDSGRQVVYATNNASRTPAEVAEHLSSLGIPTDPAQVITSAQVGAARMAELLPSGGEVLAVGGPGVAAALAEVGLTATTTATESVRGVLQGYGPDLRASDLNEAAFAVTAGAVWVATNTDLTLPTSRGIGPGNGTYVAAVAQATGATPVVVGKPEPDMARSAARKMGLLPEQCLAVGDRLDTDIEGGRRAGVDTLWVLTGVHTLVDLFDRPLVEPTYVGDDLSVLTAADLLPVRATEHTGPWQWRCQEAQIDLGCQPVVVRGNATRQGEVAGWTAAAAAVIDLRGDDPGPGGRDARTAVGDLVVALQRDSVVPDE